MSDMDHMIPQWVKEARESARRARRAAKRGFPNSAGYYEGQAKAFLRVCRAIKGWDTEARMVNAKRKRLAA